jgi:hypothetical protein
MYIQDPDGVRTYTMVADNLRQAALSPADFRALIRELADAAWRRRLSCSPPT